MMPPYSSRKVPFEVKWSSNINSKKANLVLENCPIKVNRDFISLNDNIISGRDLAIYFTYPMRANDNNSVGLVAGTGLPGLKAASQNRYFVSGSGFPDFLIFKVNKLREGLKGVVGAGYFDNSWKLDNAEHKIR